MIYSQGVRDIATKKVINEKQTIASVSRFLGINRHTITNWVGIAKGVIIRTIRPSDRSSSKTKTITDFVDKNPDLTLKEMETKLGYSDTNIGYHLKKAGYSLKKNKNYTKKEVRSKDRNIR